MSEAAESVAGNTGALFSLLFQVRDIALESMVFRCYRSCLCI